MLILNPFGVGAVYRAIGFWLSEEDIALLAIECEVNDRAKTWRRRVATSMLINSASFMASQEPRSDVQISRLSGLSNPEEFGL